MANYVLEILDGDRAGEVVPVGASTLRIGRKPGNDLVLADEKTSGVHCEIAPEDDRLVLRDLGSTNGTFLDGKRVTELVLTPGDVVTVGRTRVRFRGEDDAGAVGADSDEFAVRRLDAGRLQKRGGSIGLLVVLLLVAGGGGGWWWFQQNQQKNDAATGPVQRRDPLVVDGNRISPAIANCESDEGWRLRAAGIGFRPTGDANTGAGAFLAQRGGEEEGAAPSDDDFAVLELAEPIAVFSGRTLTVTAHGATAGGAQLAVRAVAFADGERMPFRFRHGSKLAALDQWQPMECIVTVPPGCDRLQVEVVAVLPNDEAEALVDDVAVVEAGAPNGISARLEEAGQTALGFGAAVAVRSPNTENPATVLAVAPGTVPAPLKRLHAAGLCALSDVGGAIAVSAGEHELKFAADGVDGLQFVMPADAAGGLLVASGDGGFTSAVAESEFAGRRVLFGSLLTRAMLRFDEDVDVRGRIGGGEYRLTVAAPSVDLVLGFRAERLKADSLLREARQQAGEGSPGAALDSLGKLFENYPMDSEVLADAQQLRNELLTEQGARVARLEKDLEEASFFDTRGSFERVAAGVAELIGVYGQHNVENLAAVQQLRTKAQERLAEMDRATFAAQRERLTRLADAFGATGREGLQQLVRGYIERHLPE